MGQLSCAPAPAAADQAVIAERAGSSEYEVKAEFLYKLARYTTWPGAAFEDERSPFLLAVVGDDPFGPLLESAFEGRRVDDRPVEIRRFASQGELEPVHLLFLSRPSSPELERVLGACRGRSVLVVGDEAGLALDGASAGFVGAGGEVRFEFNLDALREARLEVNPQLLKLADVVRG